VVGLIKGDSQKLLRPTPVAMVTKNWKFKHKNDYNLGCIWRTTQIPAPISGFQGQPTQGCQTFLLRPSPLP